MRLPPRAPSWKGTGQMRSPLAKRVRVPSPCGCESRPFRPGKRSGQMRGLSRKQVGVARPLWVRVPPLPPHAAVVQRTRRRALNPEAGVRLPVAVLDARSSNRKDVGLLLRLWGFESSSGSASPGGRGSRHAAANRVTGVRVPPGRPCRSDATERGSFLTSNTPRVGDPAASRRGNSRHTSFQRVHGSQTTWSSSNGEDASTPRS